MLKPTTISSPSANMRSQRDKHAWLNITTLENQQQCSKQYSEICQQHNQQKKWILVINPQKNALESLSDATEFDTSKILQVNTNKVKVNLENIENALSKGNCAAVILSNVTLGQPQLSHLASCAQRGKTPCFILKDHFIIH